MKPASTRRFLTALTLGAASVGNALATPGLVLTLLKVSSTTAGGVKSETLTETKKVNPGELLMQRAVLHTDRLIVNGHITLPIPANTHYLTGTASTTGTSQPEFSADGGKTFSAHPMKTINVTENGKNVQKTVPIPENEYSTLRWTVSTLPSGQEVSVSYRLAVN